MNLKKSTVSLKEVLKRCPDHIKSDLKGPQMQLYEVYLKIYYFCRFKTTYCKDSAKCVFLND